MLILFYAVAGILLVIAAWQIALWQWEVGLKKDKYQNALDFAKSRNKPLLITGGPYGHRKIRRWLKMPAHGGGDACLDIDRNAVEGHPNAVVASVTDIPFNDNVFGAVFASHLLEHLPTVDAAKNALAEMGRVADGVFIVSPSRQSLSGWIHPDHHLWVWQEGRYTIVEQRGKSERSPRIVKVPAIVRGPVGNLAEDAAVVAALLFPRHQRKQAEFTARVIAMGRQLQGKDFLVLHNPGGWGSTPLNDLEEWEKSLIDGVSGTIERSGYSLLLVQHFRGGRSQLDHLKNMGDHTYFIFSGKSHLVDEMAAEIDLITRHFPELVIIMLGASQGAAFGNAVMQSIDGTPRVYSIELGIIFPRLKNRVLTGRTLALDSNGEREDAVVHLNPGVALGALFSAPYRWLKYELEGHPRKISDCIEVPGHDYNWKYPGVGGKIEQFIKTNFGTKVVGG